MRINKINNQIQRQTFRGFQHEKDNFGNDVMRFNFVYDYENQKGQIEFFKVKKNTNAYAGYEIADNNPIATFDLKKDGTTVNLEDIIQLNKDEAFAYRFVIDGKPVADTGIKINDSYTLVSTKGTRPIVQGASYLAYPDSQRVGVKYRSFDDPNTGEIYIDAKEQKELESVHRTFSNKTGGNLAGLEYNLDYLAQNGYKIQFANPIAGGDNKSSHHYWNKNNFQISDDMGNIENFNSYTRKLFQKGMLYVYDGTFTSEGLEGIHFQHALRWGNKNPQTYYWFKMQGIKNQTPGLGVVPQNKENLRHVIINSPVIFNETTNKIEKNPKYNPNKETYFQIYDKTQVTEEQLKNLEKPLKDHKNIYSNSLKINSHDDTVINFAFEINPEEYIKRLQDFINFNNNNNEPIKLDSPEGAIFIGQFSNFKIDRKTEGGFVTWDANTDMVKMNYMISGYDEKLNQAITNPSEKDFEKLMRIRGAYEVQDMTLQAAKYWTKNVNDIQTLYTAQVLKNTKTVNDIENLVKNGLLPKNTLLNETEITNILNGYYNLAPKGILAKDDVTIKSLMQLPLDSLEFAENTVGVLSTSFFSNRAINNETLGLSRFELMKKDNPHLVEPYTNLYSRTNLLFTNDIKNFADEIIKKVNTTSSVKLIDENGDYTEYGEYVMELLGPSIAKYALLKSLAGNKLKTKILNNGEITYDYIDLKDNTSLKALGIKASSPQDEAEQLQRLFEKGLRNLQQSDIDYVAKSISARINGTNVNSFRLAEAMIKKAGLGLSWRLDAAKDVMDQDAGRNREDSFDQTWTNLVAFWSKFVQTIKKENNNAYIVAEITDMPDLLKDNLGENLNGYADMPDTGLRFKTVPDTMIKFFNETGITSEAGYSYFFTDILQVFGPDYTNGATNDGPERVKDFINKVRDLINTRGIDYTRNLFTFVGNHDKPRIIQGLALNMKLFHGSLNIFDNNGNLNFESNRNNRIESMIQLSNSNSFDSLPIEAKLNIDNPEYFNTVSTYAVAMSQLIRNSLNDNILKYASEDEINYIKTALVDLTNGNYLGSGTTVKIPSINIKELASLENALKKILEMAGISLSKEDFDAIIQRANSRELIEQYFIQGDFDWSGQNAHIGEKNRKMIETILRGSNEDIPSGEHDYKKYSMYTTALTGLLRQAFIDIKGSNESDKKSFMNASRDFVRRYDRATVEANRTKLPYNESAKVSMAKNAYASKDIKHAIEMVVKQAEYNAQKDGKLAHNQHFTNKDHIILNTWQNATEPAVQKAAMMMTFLSALVGLPTMYGGDELGLSGYEEKAKNIYLQNRNPLPWSELEQGFYKDYRKRIQKIMNEAMQIRSREGVDALNNGTAYMMSTSDNNIPAYMMQDGYGNMTISVFNANGISTDPRFNYHDHLKINAKNIDKFIKLNNIDSFNINNPYVPIQENKEIDYIELGEGLSLPLGLAFVNSDIRDKSIYIVKKIIGKDGKPTGRLGIYKSGGGKISLNSITAKNGAMILKFINKYGRHVSFLGNHSQYNLRSNPYKVQEKAIKGENLSIVSR